MYGITAEELHRLIVKDLKAFCRHNKVPCLPETFSQEQGRPLQQTIRLVLEEYAAAQIEQYIAEQNYVEKD